MLSAEPLHDRLSVLLLCLLVLSGFACTSGKRVSIDKDSQVSTADVNGSWQKPIAFMADKNVKESAPITHVTANGLKIVVFVSENAGTYSLYASICDGTLIWGAPKQIATFSKYISTKIVSNDKDQIAIVYASYDDDIRNPGKVFAVMYDPVSGFMQPSQVNDVAQRGQVYLFSLGIDQRGNVVVAWEDCVLDPSATFCAKLFSAWRFYTAASKTWVDPLYEADAYYPVLAVDKRDNIYTVYAKWNQATNAYDTFFKMGSFDTQTLSVDRPTPTTNSGSNDNYTMVTDAKDRLHFISIRSDDPSAKDYINKLSTTIFNIDTMTWAPEGRPILRVV